MNRKILGAIAVLALVAVPGVMMGGRARSNTEPQPIRMEIVNPPFQLVGFTSTTLQGDAGVLGFTLACQTEFPGSRMCTSEEILNTVTVPDSLSGFAWARPSFVEIGSTVMDASGATGGAQDLTCASWSRAHAAFSGLFVDSSGRFNTTATCDFPISVSCCAPVP